MPVPTTRFWLLIAAGIPLALIGAVVPGFEAVLLPYNAMLLVALVTSWLVARRWDFLTVTRVTAPLFSVGVPNPVRLDVENASDIRVRLLVRDAPPSDSDATRHEFAVALEPGRAQQLSYTITPRHRGNDAFGGTYLRVLAPLGLAWVEKFVPNQQKAPIYPNVRALAEYDLLKQKGHLALMGVRRSRVKGLGTEFESLREYNDDDYRIIDWKTTARTGKLVVRNYEVERNQGVIVALDVGRHMLAEVAGRRKLDYAIDSSLMLMHAAEKMGDQIGLLMFSDYVGRYIAPKKGRAQVSAILDTVHGVHAEPVQPNYLAAFSYLASRWKRRSLVVVFTDAENEEQAAELSAALSILRRRHLLFVVRVADPRLREVLATGVEKPTDLYHRAAAFWYFRDRKKADVRLSTGGVQSIEAEPEDLSAALVSAYLRVKELALI
ncbi:MAG: DUF58 domain-containing protein [Fimbriimonadaceae bacterium]